MRALALFGWVDALRAVRGSGGLLSGLSGGLGRQISLEVCRVFCRRVKARLGSFASGAGAVSRIAPIRVRGQGSLRDHPQWLCPPAEFPHLETLESSRCLFLVWWTAVGR